MFTDKYFDFFIFLNVKAIDKQAYKLILRFMPNDLVPGY